MPLKILFFILPLLTLSCSLLSKEECQKSRVAETAHKHGATGTSSRLTQFNERCKNTAFQKEIYQNSYSKGLALFCSSARGEEQASLGLKKEKACSSFSNYDDGYINKLNSICSSEKARIDARQLLNSDNRVCILIPAYKKTYLHYLQKQCSYQKGFNIGIQKKETGESCKDIKNITNFKRGHKAGLAQAYRNENSNLQKKIKNLKTQRKSIKNYLKKPVDKTLIQKNKIELNVIESKILELEHQLENNMRLLN